jgi:hypothetical protein
LQDAPLSAGGASDSFNGGAPVSPVYDSQGKLQSSGGNTLDFSATVSDPQDPLSVLLGGASTSGPLQLTIYDPSSGKLSNASLMDGDQVLDSATFQNFQILKLSQYGNVANIVDCTNLKEVDITGEGTNKVTVTNTTGLLLKMADSLSLADRLTPSDSLTLDQSSVQVDTDNFEAVFDATLSDDSTLTGHLTGNSLIDASNDGATDTTPVAVSVNTGSGLHQFVLGNQAASIIMDKGTFDNEVSVDDSVPATGANAVTVQLGYDESQEYAYVDTAGLHIVTGPQVISITEVPYRQAFDFLDTNTSTSLEDANCTIRVDNGTGNNSLASLSVSQLVQAIAAMPSSTTTTTLWENGVAEKGYSLSQLVASNTQLFATSPVTAVRS